MRAQWLLALVLAAGFTGPLGAEEGFWEDAERVRARVTELAGGRGSLEGFRIELMEGGMESHTSSLIGEGKIATRAWDRPGTEELRSERPVSDARVRELLRGLLAREYWTLEGTRFVPDAPTFIIRLWDGDQHYEDYSCQLDELTRSPHRTAIRQLLLDAAAGKPAAP